MGAGDPDDIPFQALVDLLDECLTAKSRQKAERLRSFYAQYLDRSRTDLFKVIRLLIPKHDSHRGNYNCQEAKLIEHLLHALSIDKQVRLAELVLAWKSKETGRGSKLATVLEELNRLAAVHSRDKAGVLRTLCMRSTARMMYWIVCIILKDLKVGMEETVLNEYHPGAQQYFGCNRDLQQLCIDLRDPSTPAPLKNVQPGNAASAQLCKQCRDVQGAWDAMKGQPCCAEFKFDGYRLMLHRTAAGQVHYFTRQGNNFRDERQYHLLDPLVEQQLQPDVPFVLDGELCVWNKARRHFEPFNSVSAVLTAIKERQPPDRLLVTGGHLLHLVPDPDYQRPRIGDVELVYIAFDVLFWGGHECVTHLPLSERHALLRTMMRPDCPETIAMDNPHICGRVAPLLPDEPFLGGPPVCRTCTGPEDIQDTLDRSMFNEDEQEHTALAAEGVVVKNLTSQWIPNDRSDAWLKIKPDYLRKHDLDAVVVGSFYSSGKRGQDAASLTQFLLALPDRGPGDSGPVQWLTFAKVGTGLNLDENRQLLHRLERASPRPRNPAAPGLDAPACVTNGAGALTKHIPDVWYDNPEASVVFNIISDIRMMRTNRFATGLSVRFPRVKAVRDAADKAPRSANSLPELVVMVQENRGLMRGGEGEPPNAKGGKGKRHVESCQR